MDRELLASTLAEAGEPSYRAKQVWEWVARGARSYEEMTNLPAGLRERLEAEVPLSTLNVAAEAKSDDGTVKTLFHTADGRPIEAVLMRYRDGRRSVCLSSQSGCPLTCTFCATGQMKFGRNLGVDEILDQALHFRRLEEIDHVVFMGMGEPTMNVDNVLAACERLPDLGVRRPRRQDRQGLPEGLAENARRRSTKSARRLLSVPGKDAGSAACSARERLRTPPGAVRWRRRPR
jgi:23S rRNA (adenine2503-C2)-methyltransferase